MGFSRFVATGARHRRGRRGTSRGFLFIDELVSAILAAMSARLPRLFLLLSKAQHRLLKSTDSTFREALGISTTQLGVLFLLEHNPGTMLKDVSEALGTNASAITGLIGRMVDAGLVRRRPSDADGRAALLFPTPDGLAKAAAARPVLARLNARLTQDFSEREIATIARFLGAVLERF
jgi:MarR family transcriptional regulator, organic hydroperoxide resistance regulator